MTTKQAMRDLIELNLRHHKIRRFPMTSTPPVDAAPMPLSPFAADLAEDYIQEFAAVTFQQDEEGEWQIAPKSSRYDWRAEVEAEDERLDTRTWAP